MSEKERIGSLACAVVPDFEPVLLPHGHADGTACYRRAAPRPPKDVLRKEVIQPQVPLRLPCYDLVLLTRLTFGRTIGAGLRVLPAWMA